MKMLKNYPNISLGQWRRFKRLHKLGYLIVSMEKNIVCCLENHKVIIRKKA